MRRSHSLFTLAAASASLALVAAVPASALPQSARTDNPPITLDLPTVTLDFNGGTALDYVNAIRNANAASNIVVLGDLQRVNMAAVKLKDAPVWAALRVLEQLPSEQGDVVAKVRLQNVADNFNTSAVFTLTADVRSRKPGADADPTERFTTVMSLADVVGDNLKPDDAMQALSLALALGDPDARPAEIKFHSETGLCIARGTIEQIETIRQVVTQLRERAGAIAARAQNDRAQRVAEERMHLENDNRVRAETDALTRQVTTERTRAEMLQQALDERQSQLSALEQQLRTVMADRDQLMRRLAQLESQIKEGKP